MKYQYDFSIADVKIRWESDRKVKLGECFMPFLTEHAAEADVLYRLQEGYPLREQEKENVLFERTACRISESETKRYRTYAEKIVQVRSLLSEDLYEIYIPKEREDVFDWEEQWIYYMSLEEMMYRRGRIILHASYVETKEGAILFTGASGVGKSTQAELWSRYGDARVMNGDRTILYEKEGTVFASGSPYAGTSGIYKNHQSPVRAIVVLGKSPDNYLRRLKGRESLYPLLENSSYPFMDEKMKMNQIELSVLVANQIPIYEYRCTKDHKAVEILREKLEE